MEIIEFREIIELFLNTSIHEIKSESEVPKINFKFADESIPLLKDIVDNPFVKKGSWTPNASQEDIDFLTHIDEDVITINVKDGYKFFELLQEITNSLIKLRNYYEIKSNPRSTAMSVMRRIWLRMGINDVNNIELFLEKQLQFINNMTFDNNTTNYEKVDRFFEYDVLMTTTVNEIYDESTRSMIILIKGNEKVYELPRILYDIDAEGICYVFGVQNASSKYKDKSIERKLYKINKNVENANVHPSKVYAMLFFINELKKKGIFKIIVPSMQVLNYRYHELLGEKAKEDLEQIIVKINEYPREKNFIRKYEQIKDWYDRVYQKQDKISYLKTEELFNLIYRIIEHDHSVEVVNDVNIQGDSLNIRIGK